MQRRGTVFQLLIAFGLCTVAIAAEVRHTTIIAQSDQESPDGDGQLAELGTNGATINDAGDVAFATVFRDEGFLAGSGMLRSDGTTNSLEVLVRSGQPAPDGNGNFKDPMHAVLYWINNSGHVAFISPRLANTFGGVTDNSGLFIAGTDGGVLQVARTTEPTEASDQIPFRSLDKFLGFNDAGQAAFFAKFAVDRRDIRGIFRSDGTSLEVTELVRQGDLTPGQDSTFSSMHNISPLNAIGQVAFTTAVRALEGAFGKDSGIFRSDGDETIEIAHLGDATPSGNGRFGALTATQLAINDSGDVLFFTVLTDTDAGSGDDAGVFLGDGVGLRKIVRRGDSTPDGNGKILDILPTTILNNAGQVLFLATVSGAADGATEGLFRSDGDEIVQIVRLGDPAAGGGTIDSIRFNNGYWHEMNSEGQVAFYARVNDGSGPFGNTSGLFFYDDTEGLIQIAREGDSIGDLGTISQPWFNVAGSANPDQMNDAGQVVYGFFAGGDAVIAVWSFEDYLNAMELSSAPEDTPDSGDSPEPDVEPAGEEGSDVPMGNGDTAGGETDPADESAAQQVPSSGVCGAGAATAVLLVWLPLIGISRKRRPSTANSQHPGQN